MKALHGSRDPDIDTDTHDHRATIGGLLVNQHHHDERAQTELLAALVKVLNGGG